MSPTLDDIVNSDGRTALGDVERALLQRLLDTHPGGAVVLDAELRVVAQNPRWVSYRADEGLAAPLGGCLEDLPDPSVVRPGLAHLVRGEVDRVRTSYARERGGARDWFELIAHRWLDAPLLLLVTVEDVTLRRREERRAETEAVRGAVEAAAALEARRLLALGQELRNPLMGLLTVVDLLLEDDSSVSQRAMLGEVKASGRSMAEVLDHIIERLPDEGADDPSARPDDAVSVRGLVHDVVRVFQGRVPQGVRLAWNAEAAWVSVRRSRLRQVLHNLLHNATRATHRGIITVEAELWRIDGTDVLHVAVSDSGPGVPVDRRASIFHTSSTATWAPQTGLGLPIAQSLVRAMGGSIWVEENPRGGAKFVVRVPVRRVEAPKHAEPGQVTVTPGARLLVVEDSPPVARALVRMLEADDHHVTAVETLAAAREVLAVESFDAVLLDRQLPDGDSGVLLDEIQASDARTGRSTLVVPITAGVSPEMREHYRRLGVRWVLEKPFEVGALRSILAEHLGGTEA